MLYRSFQTARDKYIDVGAGDSEPRYKLRFALRQALDGQRCVPSTADGWELYRNTKGSYQAARCLTAIANKMVDVILSTPLDQLAHVRNYLRSIT